ncbi:MAG: hypothetical protein PHU85_14255 [Phycisphaerae bacterium]|nr:hypothetical protein [Phycisphaerae bacterium]
MDTPRKRVRVRVILAAGVVAAAVAAGLALTGAGFGCWHGQSPGATPAKIVRADLLEGNWEGRWASTSNDMDGKLRCEIRKLDADSYEASFHAQFAKVLTHDSTVTLRARRGPGRWEFEGSKDLGLMSGGVYTYKGRVSGGEFYSTYDSSYDRGEFKMKRAVAASQPATRPGLP